jgi:type II secretory pathway pseudopilin PulG
MTLRSRNRSRGAVLMGLVVMLALLGLASARVAESATTARQRELEAELLFVGQQYRQALESYYRASPGPVKHLPATLEDLLRDPRFPQPVRHLRRLYLDPMQQEVPWGIVRRGNQIVGLYSQSDRTPLRRSGFAAGLGSFEGASHYAEWRFLFIPRAATGPTTPGLARPSASPTTTSAPP